MNKYHSRIAREHKTVECMIRIYYHGQHGTLNDFCAECKELVEYARQRLAKCLFQEKKPTCTKCSVHCYKPAKREQIKKVIWRKNL